MDTTTKNALIIVVAVLFCSVLIFYGLTYSYFAPTAPGKYSTGLLAKMRVQDDTLGVLIISNATFHPSVGFYGQDADLSGRTVFQRYSTLVPTTSCSYDSTKGFWIASVNSGTYSLVVYDARGAGTAKFYPTKFSVSVPTTDSENLEVVPNPSTAHVVDRATIAETVIVTGYNTTGSYTGSVINVKTGDYTSFRLEYTFTLTGLNTMVKGGRIYFTKLELLPVSRVLVNGAEVAIGEDTTSGEDGLVGYYVEFTDWLGGATATPTVVYCTVYVTYSGGLSGADTSFKMTLADYYEVQRPTIAWWRTLYTTETTVVDVV